jgi:hypothetical protein
MTKNPIVLVHGYSDEGKSFKPWRDVLVAKGYRVEDVNICSYESLTNEVTIKELTEGFDRALRIQAGLKDAEKSTPSFIPRVCWSFAPGLPPITNGANASTA